MIVEGNGKKADQTHKFKTVTMPPEDEQPDQL